MSVRGAARKYNIPEATLRHKVTGYHPVSKKMGPSSVLTDAEEDVIVAYIKGSLRRAHPVTKKNVLDAVGTILRTERQEGFHRKIPPFFGEKPKRKWWRLFCSRHPEITLRTPETLTTSRLNISKGVIQQWFADAQTYFADEGFLEALYDPSRQFNIDESGFSLSPKQGKVLAIRGEKHVFEESAIYHKTNITVLANVCADGRIPPPLIIYPRKRITANMAEHFPENYDCCVGKSESGYITFETLYEYLCNSFNDWLNDNNVERPIIMWTDWHETRNNYYLAKQLQHLKIIMYGLPPNTTHMMQPLDVAVFGPLKKAWSRGAKEFEHQNPDTMITQINFAEVFLPLYYDCVTADNIKSGFSKCGLYPFNAESPDYSKLVSASAQREVTSSIFEGIESEGKVERSVQTTYAETTNRGTQSSNAAFTVVCIDFLQNEGYTIISPEARNMALTQTGSKKSSQDDMLLDYKPRTSGRLHINVPLDPPPGGFVPRMSSVSSPVATPSPCHTPLSLPSPQPSCSRPDTSRRSGVSATFRTFDFYPVRREGRGPKKIRDDLDRTFAISSTKAVKELQRKMQEKEERDAKKLARGRGRRGTTTKRPAPPPQQEPSSEESEPDEPQQRSSLCQDSDDSSVMDIDDDNLCVKVSFNS